MCVLRHGEVVCRIGPVILTDRALNEGKLEQILKSRDAFGEGNGSDSDGA